MKILLFVCLFAVSCTKSINSPEELLKSFTADITEKNRDRDYYYEYTTGKMKKIIESLSDEEFEEFRNLNSVKDSSISISRKDCTEDKCSLTYVIKFDYHVDKKKEFETEVKKVAILIKEEDGWKIEDVSNIKTFHESINPINALEK